MQTLYKIWKGHEAATVTPLAGSGSNRRYYRLCDTSGQSVIGVEGQNLEENCSFVYLTRHFGAMGLPVPEVLAVSDDQRCYIQQDCGEQTLYDILRPGREKGYSADDMALLEHAMRLLPHIQVRGYEGIDWERVMTPNQFDEQSVMFDLNYFKYCFVRVVDIAYDEVGLQADLEQMAVDLVRDAGERGFMYRDFQARNVMVDGDRLTFIDYQGGKCGPLQYDVASFVWQASARYPESLRERLVDCYIDELRGLRDIDLADFRRGLDSFVLFRTLQVLGAYGLRGLTERKTYFVKSIPHAIANLKPLLAKGVCDKYPVLHKVLDELVRLPRFEQREASDSRYDGSGKLTVCVMSFSYKKGIPEDSSGNGGGYVFDCRSIHNPGRYEPYKQLTGRDRAVIDFLEDDGEITVFLEHVYRLADAHVERYIQRGFTSLMFCFGCTGGQHRSVYSAEHLAHYLHDKYGVRVHLIHREQGIDEML